MRDFVLRPVLAGLSLALISGAGVSAIAQQDAPPPPPPPPQILEREPMTGERLIEIILRVDPEAEVNGNLVQFKFAEVPLTVVFDENAGRMRAMVPVAEATDLGERLMERMLQANFDSVLDSRYAISQGLVWSVYIHPLETLTEVDFTSGLIQTVTAALTFGKEFTSGAVVYGGGDSSQLQQELQDALNAENDRGI